VSNIKFLISGNCCITYDSLCRGIEKCPPVIVFKDQFGYSILNEVIYWLYELAQFKSPCHFN